MDDFIHDVISSNSTGVNGTTFLRDLIRTFRLNSGAKITIRSTGPLLDPLTRDRCEWVGEILGGRWECVKDTELQVTTTSESLVPSEEKHLQSDKIANPTDDFKSTTKYLFVKTVAISPFRSIEMLLKDHLERLDAKGNHKATTHHNNQHSSFAEKVMSKLAARTQQASMPGSQLAKQMRITTSSSSDAQSTSTSQMINKEAKRSDNNDEDTLIDKVDPTEKSLVINAYNSDIQRRKAYNFLSSAQKTWMVYSSNFRQYKHMRVRVKFGGGGNGGGNQQFKTLQVSMLSTIQDIRKQLKNDADGVALHQDSLNSHSFYCLVNSELRRLPDEASLIACDLLPPSINLYLLPHDAKSI